MTVPGRAMRARWRAAMRPHARSLIAMSKSRPSVAGSSAALNALFRAKHPIDAGENLQIAHALKTLCSRSGGIHMSTISPELRPAVNHTDLHAQVFTYYARESISGNSVGNPQCRVWGITADAERTSDFGCV